MSDEEIEDQSPFELENERSDDKISIQDQTGSDAIVTDETKVQDDDVSRLTWKDFLKNQLVKIIGFAIMLIILVVVIDLSLDITPNREDINPPNVISIDTSTHMYLILSSSILYLIILYAFSKIVLLDHKEEFGITSWKSMRAILTFILTTSFISLIFILLDVALINVYLITGPVYVVWMQQDFIEAAVGTNFIPSTVDRLAYAEIRNLYFMLFIAFLVILPVIMAVTILSRYGRNLIKKRREKESEGSLIKDLLVTIIVPPIVIFGIFIYINTIAGVLVIMDIFVIGGLFLLGLWWLITVLRLILNFLTTTLFYTYSNVLIIIPLILVFYILPAIIWTIWDLFLIGQTHDIVNTIYSESSNSNFRIGPLDKNLADMQLAEVFQLFLQTLYLNLGSIIRILELDFVVIVGISALIIGFAEGYSILAIFKSIFTGISITKTGKMAQSSPPKTIVLTSRILYLFVWMGLLWDKLIVIIQNLVDQFNISLPLMDFPRLFTIFSDVFTLEISIVSLAILIVPFYFIITSAFKFLSVAIVMDKAKQDTQAYFLLISSAFILIVTAILADISSLDEFISGGLHEDYLPLSSFGTRSILSFAMSLIELMESLAFYAGVIVSFYVGGKIIFTNEDPDTKNPE